MPVARIFKASRTTNSQITPWPAITSRIQSVTFTHDLGETPPDQSYAKPTDHWLEPQRRAQTPKLVVAPAEPVNIGEREESADQTPAGRTTATPRKRIETSGGKLDCRLTTQERLCNNRSGPPRRRRSA